MDLESLENILTTSSGNKFCPYCGTPFKPYHSRQRTCGSPECQRLAHNEYLRDRTKRQREADVDHWRKYHREAQRKYRAKQKERYKRDQQLKELSERWERQEESDKRVYGIDYGERQKQKTLVSIPKIDVTLGGKAHDNTSSKDDITGSR